MNNHDDFRDRLIAAQNVTPEHRERYERSLGSMLNRQLTPAQRIQSVVSVLWGIAGLAVCVWALVADTGTSIQFKYLIGLLGLMVLGVTVMRGWVAVTGKINLRLQPRMIAYVSFYGILLFVIAIFLIVAQIPESSTRVYYMMVAMFPLLLATAKLILMQMDQSELNVREKLLEMELRLAELSEQMAKKQPQ